MVEVELKRTQVKLVVQGRGKLRYALWGKCRRVPYLVDGFGMVVDFERET